jgi:hypothetical protein
MLSLYGNIRLRKLHSMRENPVTSRATNTPWSWTVPGQGLERPLFGLWRLIWIATIRVVQMVLMQGYYVRMLSTKGQSACRTNGPEALHQRLNVEHPSSSWFCQWLVGVTDGDGTFSISKQNNSWNLVFKISQSSYNLRLLYYIKRMLGVGHVTVEKSSDMASFRIRDRKQPWSWPNPRAGSY